MSSSARLVLTKSRSLYQGRSLRAYVKPVPITFAERRSILTVLEQYGPIEVFKNAPNHHGSFIFITKTDKTATDLVATAELSYTVTTDKKPPDLTFEDLTVLDKVDKARPDVSFGIYTPHSEESVKKHTNFTIQITRHDQYHHAGTLDASPEHHSWPSTYTQTETFMSATLKQSLPKNMAAAAFAHWENNPDIRGEMSKKNNRLRLFKWLPSKLIHPDLLQGPSPTSQIKHQEAR